MTIRLSAMFEEHMKKIIYNWKSARRRENSSRSRNKKSRSKRRNGQRSARRHLSDDDSDAAYSSPIRKSVTPRKSNQITNGHASTSRSNGPVSRPLVRIQKEKPFKDSSDTDSEKNMESEDSYRPNNRGKKIVTRNKGKQKKMFCGESDLSDISKRTRAKTNIADPSDSDSDSDNEPLVNCVTNLNNTNESNLHNDESDEVEESDEGQIRTRLRSSHDETSQCSSSRPTRKTKKKYSINWTLTPTANTESSDEQISTRLRSSHDETSQCSSSRPTRKSQQHYTSSETENNHQQPQRTARAKRFNYRKMLEFSEDSDEENINPRTRKGKRPHYNEESEEESIGVRRNKRRHVNDDSDSNDNTNVISISSRGRIRKLTPRAKAFLRD